MITMLRNKPSQVGIDSMEWVASADRTIVTTAIKMADVSKKVIAVLTPSNSITFYRCMRVKAAIEYWQPSVKKNVNFSK